MVSDVSYISVFFFFLFLTFGEDIMDAGLWDEFLWVTKTNSFSWEILQQFHFSSTI